jgi:hypothetical protein
MAPIAALRAATPAAALAQPGRTLDPIQRQAAIENALSMALYFVRQPSATPGELAASTWAATARTNRALSLLKQAGAELGRA